MPKRSSKDPNVVAFNTVQQFLERADPTPEAKPVTDLSSAAVRRQIMQEMGRRGGLKGGKARAQALSKSQRSKIAKSAAKARWSKDS